MNNPCIECGGNCCWHEDCEFNRVVPLSVIEDIKAEIENLTITKGGEDYVRKMAELYSLKRKVLMIIDKHIGGVK